MKSLTTLTAAIAATILFSACGGAQAQVIQQTYKASNGAVFGTSNVRSIDKAPGLIVLTYSNGQSSYADFTDNGDVYSKVASDTTNWVRVGNTNRLINPDQVQRAFCNSNYSTLVYVVGTSENFLGDGCALHGAFYARAK